MAPFGKDVKNGSMIGGLRPEGGEGPTGNTLADESCRRRSSGGEVTADAVAPDPSHSAQQDECCGLNKPRTSSCAPGSWRQLSQLQLFSCLVTP